MSRYIGFCLIFAGLCLLAGAAVGVADWKACLRGDDWAACRAAKSDAVTNFSGAATAAIGVALQDRQHP